MIKILFLAANPSDTTKLKLSEEIRAIDEKLRQTEYRDKFEIQQHWAVRVGDLSGYLLRHKPDIVHFSGHGSQANEIIIEDNFGNCQPISVEAFSQLFAIFKESIRCVLLNACYSLEQAKAIAKHIKYVIGMSKEISDCAAISFSSPFYQALGYGTDVKTAFELGRVQISLENLVEKDTPQLITFMDQQILDSTINKNSKLFKATNQSIEDADSQVEIALARLKILLLLNEQPHDNVGLRISEIYNILGIKRRKIVVQALINMEMNGLIIKTKLGKKAFWSISKLGRKKLEF